MKFLILTISFSMMLALRPPNPRYEHLRARGYHPEKRISVSVPTAPTQQTIVVPLLESVTNQMTLSFITGLSSFPDRYYKGPNGLKAAQWIYNSIQRLQPMVHPSAKLSVVYFKHPWIQPTVIARYETIGSELSDIVIAGSHFDTAGFGSRLVEPVPNPGVDDAATGCAAVFEALRILVESKTILKRPVEFHFYAGEEFGLLGSQQVAKSYAIAKTQVMVYLNLDQSGYVAKGTSPKFGLAVDATTSGPTMFLKSIVQTYIPSYPVVNSDCGYPCTDHYSWHDQGFPTAMVFESSDEDAFPYNDRVGQDGSPLDTLEKISLDHVSNFVRSTLAFVVECSLA